MNQLPPPPEPVPDPASEGRRVSWHRVSVYAGGIAVIIGIWICGILFTIREHPERFVDGLLAQLPFPSSTGDVEWLNRRTLKIGNVKLGDFFYADSIVVTASPWGLLRRHIAKVQILGGQLFTKPLYDAMEKFGDGAANGLDWTIGRLEISRGTLMLQSIAADTSIPVRLGVRHPVVLNNLKLGKPDESPDMTQEQVSELVNINIVSPFDPVSPVLAFPLIRVRFTYAELWHHHIREVDLIRPTMYLGEDLFWFIDDFKKERAALPPVGPTAPWNIAHFEVQYGQLAVNVFGEPTVRFPFYFETKVSDIRLDQLDKISAKSTIPILRLDQDYPDYKVRIVNLHGKLEFSVPPTDASANNIVPTINVDELSWNNIPAKEVWSSVTFDPNGMYGKLGGKCEGGFLTGNFEIYYTKAFTWNVDLFADKVNCAPITEKLAGRYFSLTGTLNGKIAVQGKATEILSCMGALNLPNSGMLQIKSMDDLVNRIPADMSTLKKEALRIAIETFQNYPYRSGALNLNYTPKGGAGVLNLDSPTGKRQFEMYWHPYSEASSKVANEADNR